MIEKSKWFADRLITDDLADDKELSPIYGYLSQPLVSLEQALQPIEIQIEGLPEYIKIAKERCYYPNKHGLSKDQAASIYLYTMEWGSNSFYRILNTVLRSSDRNLLKPWFAFLKLFDTALKQLPVRKQNVWRGIRTALGKECKKGNELIWWSVNSCSIDVHVIEHFLTTNSTLFLIEASTAREITGYTNYPQEHEVILQPGIKLYIVADSMEHTGGLHVVHLREVEDSKAFATISLKQNFFFTKVKGHLPQRCSRKRILIIGGLCILVAMVLGLFLGLTRRKTSVADQQIPMMDYSTKESKISISSTPSLITYGINRTSNSSMTTTPCRPPVPGFIACKAFSHTYACPSLDCEKISVVYGCMRYSADCYVIGRTVTDGEQSNKWFRINQKNGSHGYVNSLYCEGDLPAC